MLTGFEVIFLKDGGVVVLVGLVGSGGIGDGDFVLIISGRFSLGEWFLLFLGITIQPHVDDALVLRSHLLEVVLEEVV